MSKDILYPLRRLHGYFHERIYERKRLNRIRKFQNLYAEKRCFIIGNGPSLCVEDLNQLKNEICFGVHRIYHIFDQTDWRPSFYCAQDQKLIKDDLHEINNIEVQHKFIAYRDYAIRDGVPKAIPVKFLVEDFYPDLPKFSEKITEGVYEGFTVTYMCLQLAAYMGFKEIYLLGVDHCYSIDKNPDGTLKKNISVKDHFSSKDAIANIPQTYKSLLAYVAARKYAENHGICIYNATRGGALDVFERVNFDALMKNQKMVRNANEGE